MYGNFNRGNCCNNCSRNTSNCSHGMNNCSRNASNYNHSMNNFKKNMNHGGINNGSTDWNLSCKYVKNDYSDKMECANNTVDYSAILNNLCDNESESINNKVCCGSNYNRRNKEELRKIIMQASFALDDIKLFLDTHPCDKEALKAYDEYKNIRKAALMEYVSEYGPISAYDVKACDFWTWVNNPWPWEGEC